ncbi:MAG: heparinase II/III family protein, partial [Gemmatimonadaceae bacterium]
MSLLIDRNTLDARAAIGAGPLAPLAQSLGADLDAVIAHGIEIPTGKALLSRDGGRCARDGAALDFDPWSPHEHRCGVCGTAYRGERHDRWWITWYQLWLAERAVHGAVLGALTGNARYDRFARDVIDGYTALYLTYPNRDNVLGPTRPFFSTYLESIWLLQLSIAIDVLELRGADENVGRRARDRIIEPSAALIASYDEGASNRQVWHNAALLAAARLLERDDDADAAVWGDSGLSMHLSEALLPDGTWYEGENYHFFAHRGLWYGVTMAERANQELMPALVARFDAGFSAPLVTALPDFTFPSRRDSQYGVTLRQWRFAESCELGLGRASIDDPLLVGALAELYRSDVPRRDTGRSRSTAEAERNPPPSSLTRADLNWRSMLCARAELPPLERIASRSAVLEGQGIGVLRRGGGGAYVALDYGVSGGGHGHPDRLNAIIAFREGRWLDDYGTGAYVDPSLHWYRSTLAHNAPLVNGTSQARVDGELVAYDERGDAGWIDARVPPEGFDAETRRMLARITDGAERRRVGAAVISGWEPPEGIADGAFIRRALVVMSDYAVDEVRFEADTLSRFELPLHVDARPDALAFVDATLAGGAGAEDGFSFVRVARMAPLAAGHVVRASIAGPPAGEVWIISSVPSECWHAVAPGAPGHGDAPFLLLRANARSARFITIWNWGAPFAGVAVDGERIRIVMGDDARHEHGRTARGWHIGIETATNRVEVGLGDARDTGDESDVSAGSEREREEAIDEDLRDERDDAGDEEGD